MDTQQDVQKPERAAGRFQPMTCEGAAAGHGLGGSQPPGQVAG